MAKRALIIRHAEPETLAANYTSALVERGFELHALNVFEGAPGFEDFDAPPLDEVDLIVALGGPQSANDSYPALREERKLMADAMASGVPVFGVCLGAQLMARVLGGEVAPTGGYEFGLRKIWVTEEGSSDPVFGKLRVPLVPTLHGECFAVPLPAPSSWLSGTCCAGTGRSGGRASPSATAPRTGSSSSRSSRSKSYGSGTESWRTTTRRWGRCSIRRSRRGLTSGSLPPIPRYTRRNRERCW